jgi:hypothetical protein
MEAPLMNVEIFAQCSNMFCLSMAIYCTVVYMRSIAIISQLCFLLNAGKMENAIARQRNILEIQKPVEVLI